MNSLNNCIKKIKIFSSLFIFLSSTQCVDVDALQEKENQIISSPTSIILYKDSNNPILKNIQYNLINQNNIINILNKIINNSKNEYDIDIFSCDSKKLLTAILLNENISNSDKKRLLPFILYFDDNKFINKEELYKELLSAKVLQEEKDDKTAKGAQFIQNENKIIIYNDYNESLPHEFFHLTMANEPNTLGSFTNESMTMILNNEYFENVNNYSYMDDYRVLYTKMMIELLGNDVMLEAYTKNDWKIIEDALLEIDPDIAKTQRIYELMLQYCEIFNNSQCDIEITKNTTIEIRNELSKILTEYFNSKEITDIDCLYELYNDQFLTGNKIATTNKYYFNKRAIKKQEKEYEEGVKLR